MKIPADLSERYTVVLSEHVAEMSSEEMLNQAYELGRAAIGYGVSVLDMVQLHHDALQGVIAKTPQGVRQKRLSKAAEFFAESLSSFEMQLRGYRESNDELRKANEALRQTMEAVEQANRELVRLATTDPLTGASNRRHFFALADQMIAQRRGGDRHLATLVLDIDHFKRINDTHGHLAGDTALRAFADAVRSELRASDVLARMGGEEFAILAMTEDVASAVGVGERIRLRVAKLKVPAESGDFSFTVSIGVTLHCGPDETVERMLARADKALYAAKVGGRDRVRIAPDC